MASLRVVVIGGGSLYTAELAQGFLRRRESLPLDELILVDVPEGREKVEAVAGLVRRMFARAGHPARVEVAYDRKPALEGADFVISQFRVGGTAARGRDERIPLRHGVIGQETTGPGGFSLALRTVPPALELAADVRERAPGAWLINFTNPSGLVTEAIHRHEPKVRSFGLCNVPLGLQRGVARALGVAEERVTLRTIGLNHLSWSRVFLDGREITDQVLASPTAVQEVVANLPALEPSSPEVETLLAYARRLGMIPNPYLRYYFLREATVDEARRLLEAGEGTRADRVERIDRQLLELYRQPGRAEPPAELGQRGGAWYSEAALGAMESLWTGRPALHVLNVPNRGATPDMPPEAVLEVDTSVGPWGVRAVSHGRLRPELRGLMQAVKAYEELTIEAAVSGDRGTALAALAAHPLVPGLRVARELLEELLEAQRPYLPRFFRD
ncbi:MAG: 6-phospho-beta-glucosidase [Bacillota bacterium]|nr:6-phospho-beta-glucosidase [Bacillota bacterium]